MHRLKVSANYKASHYGRKLAAAQTALRLMLLGSPPDMVHGAALHRACAHNQRPYFFALGQIMPEKAIEFIMAYFAKKIKSFPKEKRPMKKRRFKSTYMVIMEGNLRASAPLFDYILP